MICTPMTLRAMRVAYSAHAGQLDRGGAPYIFHPYHLAEQMDDEVSCAVALLHDVVEDTAVTLEQLKAQFPPEVTDAVALLTHTAGTDYFEYVRALKANAVARRVKLADLAHNADQTRTAGAGFAPEQLARRAEKYEKARLILTG